MVASKATTQFKFRWLDGQGRETGLLSKRGRLENQILYLDKVELPIVLVADLTARANRLIFSILNEKGTLDVFAIAVYGPSVEKLKADLDIARSATFAQEHKKELDKKGEGHFYRQETCPKCQATLILSRMPRTPQLYCYFCDTLVTVEDPSRTSATERNLKLCEVCGMFSQPRKFTIFYFYFLLVVYGWQQRITWRCPVCMRGDAWKMLFGNLVFILGVPVALIQLIRAYGASVVGGSYAGLDRANIMAKKGHFPEAISLYRAILSKVRHSAGIKYNIGISLRNTQPQLAVETFEAALKDCSNYSPAFQALRQCYQTQGESTKLEALNRIWDVPENKAPEPS